jgi:hypothetical protein
VDLILRGIIEACKGNDFFIIGSQNLAQNQWSSLKDRFGLFFGDNWNFASRIKEGRLTTGNIGYLLACEEIMRMKTLKEKLQAIAENFKYWEENDLPLPMFRECVTELGKLMMEAGVLSEEEWDEIERREEILYSFQIEELFAYEKIKDLKTLAEKMQAIEANSDWENHLIPLSIFGKWVDDLKGQMITAGVLLAEEWEFFVGKGSLLQCFIRGLLDYKRIKGLGTLKERLEEIMKSEYWKERGRLLPLSMFGELGGELGRLVMEAGVCSNEEWERGEEDEGLELDLIREYERIKGIGNLTEKLQAIVANLQYWEENNIPLSMFGELGD